MKIIKWVGKAEKGARKKISGNFPRNKKILFTICEIIEFQKQISPKVYQTKAHDILEYIVLKQCSTLYLVLGLVLASDEVWG